MALWVNIFPGEGALLEDCEQGEYSVRLEVGDDEPALAILLALGQESAARSLGSLFLAGMKHQETGPVPLADSACVVR